MENKYLLTIGSCTRNREEKAVRLIHQLAPFLLTWKNSVNFVIVNDGGSDLFLGSVIDAFKLQGVNIDYIKFEENQGVYVSKTTAMLNANSEWYIHIDDDDSFDMNTLDYVFQGIINTGEPYRLQGPSLSTTVIQYNVSKILYGPKQEVKLLDRFRAPVPTRQGKIEMSLMGLLFKISDPRIQEGLKEFVDNWRSYNIPPTLWSDDVIIPGAITKNIPDNEIKAIDLKLALMDYYTKDYHIVFDAKSKRKESKELREQFWRWISLKGVING